MEGLIDSGVCDQVLRPHDKLVVGTKSVFKCKIDKDGEIEKYKARLVAQGFRQAEGLHTTDSYSPTSTAASVRILLAVAVAQDLELRQPEFEREFLQADVDGEIYVELPKGYQAFLSTVGKLSKAIDGLAQVGRYWNTKLTVDLHGVRFEQGKAGPCVCSEQYTTKVKQRSS